MAKSEEKPVVKTKQAAVKKSSVATSGAKNTTVAASTSVKAGIAHDVYDLTGKVVESMTLPSAIFGAKINETLMTQAVRVYMANQRQGSARTKTRGEVHGSSRKIYQQKGTGRARHGSIRAPIFVHGGVALGPRSRDFSLSMPQKMRQRALASSLTSKLKDGKVTIVTGMENIGPKTKEMNGVMGKLGVSEKKRNVLLVLPMRIDNVARSARNIQGVGMLLANQLNTYEVLRSAHLIFLKDAVSTLKKHFEKQA